MNIRFNTLTKRLFLGALCFIAGFIASVLVKKYSWQPGSTQPTSVKYTAQSTFDINLLKKSNPTKAKHWDAMEQKVATWGDALGLGIDPGIKNPVIVLNLLGFATSASCEGHIDWGFPYPWVDFEIKDNQIDALNNKAQNIYKQIDEKEQEIQKKYPDLSLGAALQKEETPELNKLYAERLTISDKIQILAKTKLIPLRNLINDFYKNRPIDPDRMIAINAINPTFLRMYSLGGDWQIVRSEKEKLKKLKEYQEEMRLLAEFLTNYYFKKSLSF